MAARKRFSFTGALEHVLAPAGLVVALVFAQRTSGWAEQTLFCSGILALLLLGALLPRLASIWPASFALLLLLAAKLVPLLPVGFVAILVLETVRARRADRRLTAREVQLLAVFMGIVFWMVVIPGVEMHVSGEGDYPIVVALLLLASARSLVSAGARLRAAGRLNPIFRYVPVALLLALAAQLYGFWWGTRAEPAGPVPTPMAIAHEVRRDLAEMYPRWKSDPQQLDGLWAGYRHELAAASTTCMKDEQPCFEMLHVLRRLLAELHNGHTGVFIPSELGLPPVELVRTDDGVAIDWVDEGSSATRGLARGQRVVAMDGLAVEEAAKQLPSWANPHEAVHKREHESYRELLSGLPGTALTLTVEMPDKGRRIVHLERRSMLGQWEEQQEDDREPELEWSVDDGIGLVWIEGFDGSTLAKRFDRAMAQMQETRGLILDLRDNGGGNVKLALEVLGHFFDQSTVLGEDCIHVSWEDGPNIECSPRWVHPSSRPYPGRVAVLIDEEVVSAAEIVAYGLCRVRGARCFGRPTAGETDCVVSRDVPGAVVTVASSEFRPAVGQAIQGVGLEPDVRVPFTLEDLRSERDPAAEAARDWLASEIGGDRIAAGQ